MNEASALSDFALVANNLAAGPRSVIRLDMLTMPGKSLPVGNAFASNEREAHPAEAEILVEHAQHIVDHEEKTCG